MTRLEECSCGQLAVLYIHGKWLCKVCQAIENWNPDRINGFILKGRNWPSKEFRRKKGVEK